MLLFKKLKKFFHLFIIFTAIAIILGLTNRNNTVTKIFNPTTEIQDFGGEQEYHPLSIDYLRNRNYPGSQIKIEKELEEKQKYQQFIASYESDGLKIFALLTIPKGEMPAGGWPAIVFNHGYIPPDQYKTNERYTDYVNKLASSGYVVFKIDYRGHGESEGNPEGGYGSNAYTIDALNALTSLQKFDKVNPEKIGVWGHSMGGWIALRMLVAKPEKIKAAVIWAGVVGSYQDLLDLWWSRRPTPNHTHWRGKWRNELISQYGPVSDQNEFWKSISPTTYIYDIQTPIQLHHARGDTTVPIDLSEKFYNRFKSAGKPIEFYPYQGDNHNISQNFSLAMQRTIQFFDKYLK